MSEQTTAYDWGGHWLGDKGFSEDVAERIRDAAGSALEATDLAADDPDVLLAIDGVGEAAVEQLAALSPLTPPGEWSATKHTRGEYTFTVDGAVIETGPAGERWEATVEIGSDGLLDLWQIQRPDSSPLVCWWSVGNVLEANPQGPNSAVPRNVTAPEPWFLWANHYGVRDPPWCAWENQTTDTELRIVADGDTFVLRRKQGTPAEREEIDRGSWAAMLDAAEAVMADATPDPGV